MPRTVRPFGAEARELTRVAASLLGDDRVAELADALAERDAQLRQVEDAAAKPVQNPGSPLRTMGPTPASVAARDTARRRIAELDGRLEAFAWLADEEEQPAIGGNGRPLDGYVVAVKDVINVEGMPTRCGSPITTGAPATTDASLVTLARDAGAAIIGKTHCTEWALNDPAPTSNPHDHNRTPGGSSAGSAVAVATGMCTASIDTQTAGDVVRPAAFNGVVGYKPTIGWAALDGIQPVAPTIDTIGVIARDVAGAAAVAAAIADLPGTVPAAPRPTAPRRVGVLADPFVESADRAVKANVALVANRFADAGARVDELRAPIDLFRVHAAHRVITFAECAAQHRARYRRRPAHYGPRARDLIDLGLITPATAYVDAQRVRHDAAEELAELLTAVDLLVMPTTPGPATLRDTTGDSTFQIPWTLCGFPVVALPSGTDEGLPLGVQLIAAAGRDDQLLANARWCEDVLDVHLTPIA